MPMEGESPSNAPMRARDKGSEPEGRKGYATTETFSSHAQQSELDRENRVGGEILQAMFFTTNRRGKQSFRFH